MKLNLGIFSLRAQFLCLLLTVFPLVCHPEVILVGDIEIDPEDFSAEVDPEKRIAPRLQERHSPAQGNERGRLLSRRGNDKLHGALFARV